MGVLASAGSNGQNAHASAVTRAIQDAADFDPAARKALEPFIHQVANLFDHHQGVLDGDRALRGAPGFETLIGDHPAMDYCTGWSLAFRRPGTWPRRRPPRRPVP